MNEPLAPDADYLARAQRAVARRWIARGIGLLEPRCAPVLDDFGNERRPCASCGAVWILTAKNRWFFIARGLALPRRCESCRHARRQERR